MNGPAQRTGAARIARGFAALGLPLFAFAILGALWVADRTRPWSTPRWGAEQFELARAAPAAESPLPEDGSTSTVETWVMVVHPGCPHCAARVHQVAADARARGARFVALAVDQSARPEPDWLESLPEGEVRWDRRGIWRTRWGHRAYGEVLRFDRHGRLRPDAVDTNP